MTVHNRASQVILGGAAHTVSDGRSKTPFMSGAKKILELPSFRFIICPGRRAGFGWVRD